ncbi:MAG TPA: hypothetical protein VNM24_05020 [Burkholderiales bacterium]|jgi:hypothetical protein|nr:hypothetical protein [Burkholderiales bacterium]
MRGSFSQRYALDLGIDGPGALRGTFPNPAGGLNLALVVTALLLGLIVDRYGGLTGQLAASVWMWAVFFRLLGTSPRGWRLPFYACLIWSAAGEIFLSLVWGLYTYRLENIPFFVPPGHVLVLWLGLTAASRAPRWFVAAVPAIAALYALAAWWCRFDTFSILLTGMFLLCMFRHEGRVLYAVMFVLSLLMELYGTWMGNWVWHREVPYFGLTSLNPPLAVGAFYCVLDVLVGMTARGLTGRPRAFAAQLAVSASGVR